MAQLKVNTVFSAVDKVSGPIRRIGKAAATQGARIKSSFASAGTSVSRFGAMAALGISVLATGALGRAVTDFANLADQTGKTSRRLGLSVEAFQELKHAADINGVSATELESAFMNMNKAIGQAQAGTGRLTSFLKKSRPALLDQIKNAKTSEERFGLLVGALDKMPDAAAKTALATAAFGGAGAKMINMAEGGTKSLAKLRAEARKLGILDTESTQAAEKFNDSMLRLKKAVTSFSYVALVPIIKYMTPLIDRLRSWVMENRAIMSSGIDTFLKVLSVTFGAIFKVIGWVLSAVARVNDVFGGTLIPLIIGGILVFKGITLAIAAYNTVLGIMAAVKLTAAASGGILNAVLYANPIGLVVLAVVALIAVGILLYKNWDKLAPFFAALWEKIKSYFFAAWEFIKKLLIYTNPILLIVHFWEPISDFFVGLWDRVIGVFVSAKDRIAGIVKGLISLVQPVIGTVTGLFGSSGGAGASGGPVGPNTAALQRSEHRSSVDVNFRSVPNSVDISQRGSVPGIRVNTGQAAFAG